jgi:hypothetical protein
MTKSIFASWTFWFGVAQIVVAGLGFLSGNMGQSQALTLAVTGFGTIGFRIKTTQPVSISGN